MRSYYVIKIKLKVKFNLKRGFLISGFDGLPAVGNPVLWEKVLYSHETLQNLLQQSLWRPEWGEVGTKLFRNPLPFGILLAQGHLSPFIADEASIFFALCWVQVSFCHLLL